MTAANKPTDARRRLQAQIHIARKDLGLDEDTYRAALMRVTGKTSTKQLSVPELMRVVDDFKAKGFKVRKQSPNSSSKRHKTQVDKIRAIWIHMGKIGIVEDGSEAALEKWVKHQTSLRNGGVGIERVEWLDSDIKIGSMIIESLKQWCDRVLRQWENDDLRLVSQHQTNRDRPQADIVRELLEAHRIMWWFIFADLGIKPLSTYVTDRRLLHRE